MIEDITILYENGMSKTMIADNLNISLLNVEKVINEKDLKIKKENFNYSMIEDIIELYKCGISAKNLGIKYSIDKRRILSWAELFDVKRDKTEEGRIKTFNQKIFDKIDSIDKAYWLGFLYADGYNGKSLNYVGLTLSTIDRGHIEKFCKFLDIDLKYIKDRVLEKENKKYYSSRISLNSKYFCQSLHNVGCIQAKSLILKYPKWLDQNLEKYFIRGYFDGDGCLKVYKKNKEWKFNLVSTKEFCEDIANIIYKNTLITTSLMKHSKNNKNTYIIESGGNKKVYEFMSWLYDDADNELVLSRKFLKYKKLKKQLKK